MEGVHEEVEKKAKAKDVHNWVERRRDRSGHHGVATHPTTCSGLDNDA